MPRPYVALTKGIAQADAFRLVSPQHQQLAKQMRRVEDPLQIKRKAQKVRTVLNVSFSVLAYEGKSHLSLTKESRSRAGYRSVIMRASFEHSYSEARVETFIFSA